MVEKEKISCPDCNGNSEAFDRRNFVKVLGGSAVTLVGLESVSRNPLFGQVPAQLPATPAPAAQPRQPRPAEALIAELYQGLTVEQKGQVVYAWDHRQGTQSLTRKRMFNAPFAQRIGQAYTQPQQELVGRILQSMANGEEGYRRLTRNNTFDGSGSLGGCGAYIFGNPTDNGQYAFVFMGHHITVRCDGNSEANSAFGGPIYYGHSPDGASQRNVFNYQTRAVQDFFDSLTEQQRRQAVATGNPGEQEQSVRFRNNGFPGIRSGDLTADQRRHVETVMQTILNPFRQADADEVMQIVRQNGGMSRIHLAFYRDRDAEANTNWSFWRLEGPGFVWNFRVLPHVHTFVNIAHVANS